MDAEKLSSVDQLLGIMRQLRDPHSGCAWDIKQNFQSIAPYTLEEAYEVVDAIERGDLDDLKDELGDLLLQVVFHAQMASEQNLFDFEDVARAIVDKMIRRHPHVFSDAVYQNEEQLKTAWDAVKQQERQSRRDRLSADGKKPVNEPLSALDGIAVNLPALQRAEKIQKRAARVGFDWSDIAPVWDKLTEEIAEVREALMSDDADAVEDEIGDLLFTVVNLARHADVDSESALRRASGKFAERFKKVEQLANDQGQCLSAMQMEELDDLWEKSKDSG